MYKCVHGFATKLLCDMIEMASDVNIRNTRNTNSLNVYIPKPNIECYRKYFKYAGGKIWNDLPNNIQNAPSVDAFNMPIRKLISNTGTFIDASNFISERFYIILMCTIYFFTFVILFVLYILHIITQDLIEKQLGWICYPV